MKVSSQGRIEPHDAVYRLEPSAAGRVVRSLLNLDEEVEQGDLLIELDTRSEQLELEQSKATALAQDLTIAWLRRAGATNWGYEATLDSPSFRPWSSSRGLDLVERADAPRRRRARCTAELHSASGLVKSLSSLGTLHGDFRNRPSLAISHASTMDITSRGKRYLRTPIRLPTPQPWCLSRDCISRGDIADRPSARSRRWPARDPDAVTAHCRCLPTSRCRSGEAKRRKSCRLLCIAHFFSLLVCCMAASRL